MYQYNNIKMDKTGGRLFGAKLNFSNKINKILKKYGDKKIKAIRVGRRPIDSRVEKAFNIISLGQWDKLRKDYYYDTLFHLFLIITMDDGSVISFEKNSIVTMTENDGRCSMPNVDCIELEYPVNSITLNDIVKKPLERIGKEKYFIYDPFSQNCQIFISEILKTFDLLSKKSKDFIYQDISEIVKKLPFFIRWVAKSVTDADATVSKIIGAGDNKPTRKFRKNVKKHYIDDMGYSEEDAELEMIKMGGSKKQKDITDITKFMLDVVNDF